MQFNDCSGITINMNTFYIMVVLASYIHGVGKAKWDGRMTIQALRCKLDNLRACMQNCEARP